MPERLFLATFLLWRAASRRLFDGSGGRFPPNDHADGEACDWSDSLGHVVDLGLFEINLSMRGMACEFTFGAVGFAHDDAISIDLLRREAMADEDFC